MDPPSPQLHFSLARSRGVALIAVAAAPVGVDIQAVADQELATEVSALLHPAEEEEIASAPPSERAKTFTRIWTRKEAYVKGIGTGIAHDLSGSYLGTERRAATPRGWMMIELAAPDGYLAAAAVHDAKIT